MKINHLYQTWVTQRKSLCYSSKVRDIISGAHPVAISSVGVAILSWSTNMLPILHKVCITESPSPIWHQDGQKYLRITSYCKQDVLLKTDVSALLCVIILVHMIWLTHMVAIAAVQSKLCASLQFKMLLMMFLSSTALQAISHLPCLQSWLFSCLVKHCEHPLAHPPSS